jgi:hypothetical protein
VKIDADAPALNLAPIQFRNWDEPGIAIRADKAAQHAGNLRLIAEHMMASDRHFADYLRRFAGQLSPAVAKTKTLVQDNPPPPEPEAA